MSTRRKINTLVAGGALALLPWAPHADNLVEFFVGHYQDDARLQAWTPSVAVSHDLNDDLGATAKYTFEQFDKAAPATVVDAVSSATTVAGGSGGGFTQTRQEGALSGRYRVRDATLAMGYVLSKESDFASHTYSVGYAQDMLGKNLTLGVQYALSLDDIDTQDLALADAFPKRKLTHSGAIGATQVVDAQTLFSTGYTVSSVAGLQSQPTRKIRIVHTVGGIQGVDIWPEVHPEERLRHGVFARLKHYYLLRGALDMNATYYRDDWNVRAASADTRYTQYLGDHWLLRGRYRYYRQGAADFYRTQYDAYQPLLSADTRLRAFSAHTVGIKLSYLMSGGHAYRPWQWSLAYDRYWETAAGVTADIVKFAVQVPY